MSRATAATVKLHRGAVRAGGDHRRRRHVRRFRLVRRPLATAITTSSTSPTSTRDVDGDVVAEFCNFALANTAILRKNSHA